MRVDIQQGNITGFCSGKRVLYACHKGFIAWIQQSCDLVGFAIEAHLREHIRNSLRRIRGAHTVVAIGIRIYACDQRAIGGGRLGNLHKGGIVFHSILGKDGQYGFPGCQRCQRAAFRDLCHGRIADGKGHSPFGSVFRRKGIRHRNAFAHLQSERRFIQRQAL